ncbi:MAG: hypothetical protein WAS49_15885 [Candidatus Dechloromonas phosphoritropha]
MQPIKSRFGLVFLDGFAHVLSNRFKVALVDRGGQRVQLGDRCVVHHAAGDFPAIVGQFG